MTGAALFGLVLLSMGWLSFLGGLAGNYQALRRSKPGETMKIARFLPGVVGSITVFFYSIPGAARYGLDLPWPWLWIALPLFIDPYCIPGLVLLLLRK